MSLGLMDTIHLCIREAGQPVHLWASAEPGLRYARCPEHDGLPLADGPPQQEERRCPACGGAYHSAPCPYEDHGEHGEGH